MTAESKKQKLARLGEVLDVYGADLSRWPETDRRALQTFIEVDAQARELHREAQALAKVMDAAPSMRASADLKAGIVAAATSDEHHEAKVVPIDAGRRPGKPGASPGQSMPLWPAAALAASFALGVYLGVSGVGGIELDNALRLAELNDGSGAEEAGYAEPWLDGNGGGDAGGLL